MTMVEDDGFINLLDGSDPEWMMFFGETGSGKTFRYLQVLESVRQVDEEAKFFIIDTDQAVRTNIQHFPDLRDSGQVKATYVRKWDDYKGAPPGDNLVAATNRILGQCQRRDWIVVDRASYLWKLCPDAACRKILGKSAAEIEKAYQFQSEGKAKGGNALLQYYGSVINPFWRQWEERVLYESGCNVIFVCSEQELRDGESRGKVTIKDKHDTLMQFEKVGIRPAIQNDSPFKFHTVMAILQPYHKDWRITTCRERGDRGEPFFRERVADLGTEYLFDRAGYQVP